MDVLLQLEGVNSSLDIKGLRHLYDKVEAQVTSLKAHRMSKLPQDLCLMVSREVSRDEWDFEAILKVIEKEVEARERAVESSVTKKNVRSVPIAASLLAGSAKSEHVSCCYCEQNHSSARCAVPPTSLHSRYNTRSPLARNSLLERVIILSLASAARVTDNGVYCWHCHT